MRPENTSEWVTGRKDDTIRDKRMKERKGEIGHRE